MGLSADANDNDHQDLKRSGDTLWRHGCAVSLFLGKVELPKRS